MLIVYSHDGRYFYEDATTGLPACTGGTVVGAEPGRRVEMSIPCVLPSSSTPLAYTHSMRVHTPTHHPTTLRG